jgi:hypothetical protein
MFAVHKFLFGCQVRKVIVFVHEVVEAFLRTMNQCVSHQEDT